MHLLVILLMSALPKITETAYTCGGTGATGPCNPDGTCPNFSSESQTCLGVGCCPDSRVLPPGGATTAPTAAPTVAPTAASTASTCVDLTNPSTGVSDCPGLSYLCNDATYYTLMTQQCPKTCNRCPGTANTAAPTSSCRDLVHYQTGISDCPSRAYLCTNSMYQSLMQIQCPKTCGYCV